MISIVIPVYNVEKYLKDCMESVLTQTYTDFEVLLVDDGSTDGCSEICNAYAEKDARIQVIHKTNGGLSDARNTGTAAAVGDWVFYLDSDDYLEKNTLEMLAKLQREYRCDIIIANYSYMYEDHEDSAETQYTETTMLSNHDAMKALITGKLQNFAWGKLIRAEIAKKHVFPKGRIFEDHYWTHEIFAEADTVVFCPIPLIHYRQRENSISYTMNLERLDILEGWKVRKEFLAERYPELESIYQTFIAKQFISLAWLVMRRMKGEERKLAEERMVDFLHIISVSEIQDEKTKCYIKAFYKNRVWFIVLFLLDRFR